MNATRRPPNRYELTDDPGVLLRKAMAGSQSELWTALPCTVKSFDPARMTLSCLPAVQAQVRRGDDWTWTTLPLLVDVPVVFPSAGGFTLTFPVAAGDEVLVVFASRCIDLWWQKGGQQPQAELRMHDLSDGFAIPGPRSQPRVVPAISTTAVELRSDDGQTSVSLDRTGSVTIKCANALVQATGSANVIAPTITMQGAVAITGTLSVTGTATVAGILTAADVTVPGILSYKAHLHGNVKFGSDRTGVPQFP